jgi:hypothetical protein
MKQTWNQYFRAERELNAGVATTRAASAPKRDKTITLPLPAALGARYLMAALQRIQQGKEIS